MHQARNPQSVKSQSNSNRWEPLKDIHWLQSISGRDTSWKPSTHLTFTFQNHNCHNTLYHLYLEDWYDQRTSTKNVEKVLTRRSPQSPVILKSVSILVRYSFISRFIRLNTFRTNHNCVSSLFIFLKLVS